MKKGKVIQSYQAQYPDPIVMKKGEPITPGRRDPEWPGWVWCTDIRGKSGWVPERYIDQHGEASRALQDYAAIELTVNAGEELALGALESGWYWATNSMHESGWVPARNIELIPG